MSNKTHIDNQRRLVPVVMVCLVLIGIAAWVSVLLPQEPKPDDTPVKQVTQQVLREWNGQIALFEENADEPIEVYEVTVAALPEEEQQRLRAGIVIDGEEMLAALIDNYTS